jgi:hypothetical protein
MSRNVTVDFLRAHIATQLAGMQGEPDVIADRLSHSIVKDVCPHLSYNRTADGYSRKPNRRNEYQRQKDNKARYARLLRKKAADKAAAAASAAEAEAEAAAAALANVCVLGECVCGGEVCEVC